MPGKIPFPVLPANRHEDFVFFCENFITLCSHKKITPFSPIHETLGLDIAAQRCSSLPAETAGQTGLYHSGGLFRIPRCTTRSTD